MANKNLDVLIGSQILTMDDSTIVVVKDGVNYTLYKETKTAANAKSHFTATQK